MKEPRRDWFSLPKPWLELLSDLRHRVIEEAGEIRTCDGGLLKKSDGQWEIVQAGTSNDADVVMNASRIRVALHSGPRPRNHRFGRVTACHANRVACACTNSRMTQGNLRKASIR